VRRTGHQEAHTAQFFSGTNEGAMKKREQLAEESLEMLISWLRKGGNVAIHGQYSEPCRLGGC
jgi:6-phosphofructo-2-kinase/fructose-2,6-biphosphatase 2